MRTALLLSTVFCLLAGLAACEEPTIRPTRAVASPTNSSEREVRADQPAGGVAVPVLTIDMPNDKYDTARVRAFGKPLNPTTATAPATAPSQRSGTIDLSPRGTPPATQP